MPAWTPASIASALWLDFSDTSKLFDATSGGSAVTNGVGIARAEDKSGNGRHFTQSTAGARPTYTTGLQNSLGGAVFDGGDLLQHATISTWNFLHSAQSTIFIVQKSGSSSDPVALYVWMGNNGNSSANRGVHFGYDDRNLITGLTDAFSALCADGASVSSYGSVVAVGTSVATEFRNVLTPNVHQLCTITSDPTNATAASRVKLAVNGGTLVGNNDRSGASSTSNASFNLQIGANNSSQYLVGNILEIVVLNYAASTDIRQRMEGYLAWKWGLQSSLPSGHPYKNAEPGALPYKYPSLRDAVAGYMAGRDTGAAASDQFTVDGSQDGTLTNGATRVNDGGLAYSFDGVNDYITAGDVLDSVFTGTSARFTIAAWVKLTASGNCMILSKLGDGSHGENNRQFGFRCNGGALNMFWFGAADGSTVRVLTTSTNLNGAGWQHVAMTFDATISNADNKATLWLNGSSQTITVATSTGSPVSIPDTTARLSAGAAIGASSSTVSYQWQGCIDDLLIYPRILSATEIANLASARGAAYQQTGTRRRRSTMGAGIL